MLFYFKNIFSKNCPFFRQMTSRRSLLFVLGLSQILLVLLLCATPTSAKINWNTKAKEHTDTNRIDGGGKRNSKVVSIDSDDLCQLRLYRVKSFQGRPYILSNNRRRLKGLEKSMQSTGKESWAVK